MTLDLFGDWFNRAKAAAKPTLEERFEAFHAAHPHVATEMLRLARARLARGDTYISAKALWEELRMSIATNGDGFKLNNSLVSRYADLLIATDPSLAAVIERRKRRG